MTFDLLIQKTYQIKQQHKHQLSRVLLRPHYTITQIAQNTDKRQQFIHIDQHLLIINNIYNIYLPLTYQFNQLTNNMYQSPTK